MATKVPEIIGLPPRGYISDNFINSSIPVAEFRPSEPQFQKGLTVFRAKETSERYLDILSKHGYEATTPLKLAFLADNFPTDTFRNEYGSHFLEGISNVVSESAAGLAQTMGSRTGTGAIEKMSDALKETGGLGGMLGSGLGMGVDKVREAKQSLEGTKFGGVADMLDRILAGARVDFPQIWKGSGFQPSYTMTVRLYNPDPASSQMTDKFIIAPLAAILTLGLPQSKDDGTYQWPFIHKIKSRGLYILDPAVITNISVIKGGDQQQIAFNQRLSIVDVRLDITGLFQTMLLNTEEEDINGDSDRPTLKQYLENLKDERFVPNIYDPGGGYGIEERRLATVSHPSVESYDAGGTRTPTDPSSEPEPRIAQKDKNTYENLKA